MRYAIIALLAVVCTASAEIPREVMQRMLMVASYPVEATTSGPDVGTPYSWWKMTGTDTNTTDLLDFMGHMNVAFKPAVTNGPAYEVDAYKFDNADDFFEGTNDVNFSSTQKTVTAWVYNYSGYTEAIDPIIAKYDNVAKKDEWIFNWTSDSKIRAIIGNTNETKYIIALTPTCPQDQWLHVAFTWNGGTNLYVYTNGVRATASIAITGGWTPADTVPTTTPVTIGKFQTFFFIGYMRNVCYFTTVLTDNQISNRYSLGRIIP